LLLGVNMALYDSIGQNYAQSRRSDPRIAEKLLAILAATPAKTIADIGAGMPDQRILIVEFFL
jgi:hypothetical protein